MAELKTKKNEASVEDFLNKIEDKAIGNDCKKIIEIMQKATNSEPKMWGGSIVGFGSYHYKYQSGREGDWMLVGFSPRKQNLTLYIMDGFTKYGELMSKLGKHKTGKSCLYIKRLSDIDLHVLQELVLESIKGIQARYK